MSQIVNVADIKDTKTGKTWREENGEKTHKIPLDALVEVIPWEHGTHNGVRGYVSGHGRDCDGTPLYSITMEKGLRVDKYGPEFIHLIRAAFTGGFSEESLKVIMLPDEQFTFPPES